jgi:hypothetical protein
MSGDLGEVGDLGRSGIFGGELVVVVGVKLGLYEVAVGLMVPLR